MSRLALLSAVALLACGGAACGGGERVQRSEAAIIDGSPADGDAAVVGLHARGELYCSAALVAGHVALTAAHCLPPEAPLAVSEIEIFSGASPSTGGWFAAALDVWVHPEHLEGATGRDVGLVALQHAIAEPFAVSAGPPAPGDVLRVVGFGRTDPDAVGDDRKRTGAAEVVSVADEGILLTAAPSVTCGGDSGGPALAGGEGAESIAGVHARGTCEFEMTEMRADLVRADIERFIAEHAPPSCDADGRCALGCPERDGDCPISESVAEPDGGCSMGRSPSGPESWVAGLVVLAASRVTRRRWPRRPAIRPRARSRCR